MKMKTTEIFELNNELNNIFVHPDILNKYSKGKEWSDIAFSNLKTIDYRVVACRDDEEDVAYFGDKSDRIINFMTEPRFGMNGEMTQFIFEETPEKDLTWKELMTLVDNLVGRSGDKSHEYFVGFEIYSVGCVNHVVVLAGS
jgi:hypothetical protein